MLQVKLCLLQIEKKYIYFAFVTESHHLGLFLNIFFNLFAIFPNANVKNNGLKVWMGVGGYAFIIKTCTWHHCIQHMYTLTTGLIYPFTSSFLLHSFFLTLVYGIYQFYQIIINNVSQFIVRWWCHSLLQMTCAMTSQQNHVRYPSLKRQ